MGIWNLCSWILGAKHKVEKIFSRNFLLIIKIKNNFLLAILHRAGVQKKGVVVPKLAMFP